MHSLALIVHNDLRQARHEFADLETFGIKPYAVNSLKRALDILAQWSFDVVLLESENLQEPLYKTIAELRAAALPVIVLVGAMDEAAQIRCLESGAVEVVRRPLSSHLTALMLRRVIELTAGRTRAAAPAVHVGPLMLDTRRSKAMVGAEDLQLTRQQFEIALLLAVRVGEFVNRHVLAQASRQRIDRNSRSVDMQVCKIRKKLRERGAATIRIDGVYGRGYCLTDEAAPTRSAAPQLGGSSEAPTADASSHGNA